MLGLCEHGRKYTEACPYCDDNAEAEANPGAERSARPNPNSMEFMRITGQKTTG